MPRLRLTPDIERLIVATIRAGAYPHIAAAAAGVPRAVFRRWLRRGRDSGRRPYRSFWQNVLQAKAHARLNAEMDARKKDVKFWLRYGPGKEAADAPGWAVAKKSGKGQGKAETLDKLLPCILAALTPFPEARQALVAALEQ